MVEEDGSFTEFSIEGLAEAFQAAFKESILPNSDRSRILDGQSGSD